MKVAGVEVGSQFYFRLHVILDSVIFLAVLQLELGINGIAHQ